MSGTTVVIDPRPLRREVLPPRPSPIAERPLQPARNSATPRAPKPPPQVILQLVGEHYQVGLRALKAPGRRRHLSDARFMAMHLLRRLTRLSYAEIGRVLGRRHHTTIVHGVRRFSERAAADLTLAALAANLEQIARRRLHHAHGQ